MWKGILFVIAIIVTFDIGTSLIDQYQEEQAEEQSEEVLEQAHQGGVDEPEPGESTKSGEVRQLLDLSLPEGIEDSDSEGTAESQEEQGNIFDSPKGNSQKSMNIKTRPILEFQTKARKPDVSGLKFDLKKEL